MYCSAVRIVTRRKYWTTKAPAIGAPAIGWLPRGGLSRTLPQVQTEPARGATETPLSPTVFLERAARVFSDRVAIRDEGASFTYGEFAERTARLVRALECLGITPGERVAALCTNSHVMLELHHGVPMLGAVLVPLNLRLTASDLAYMLDHCAASLLVATKELAGLASEVAAASGVRLLLEADYAEHLAAAVPAAWRTPEEHTLLAINYTSGSTGRPKGVMYNHRGAYLQALAMAYHLGLGPDSNYLWTLPMFHCDGWCLTWAVTATGGTHHCLRQVDPAASWSAIASGEISHLSAAPTVLAMIAEAAGVAAAPPRRVRATTGGAPPSPALLSRLERLGLEVTHLYGLTESYGPAVVNTWQATWSARPPTEQAALNARQGIGNIVTGGVRVLDESGEEVPADGATLGEIALRGNNIMVGYYDDPEATAAAVRDGWLWTGDLGVLHPDGYVELKDRAKDIIITGGENVASVEVERTLAEHPGVLECAVVAMVEETWGEVPVAFVTLREGAVASEQELIDFARERLAHFKAPKAVYFGELPKTSTGKVQKHVLRAHLAGPPATAAER